MANTTYIWYSNLRVATCFDFKYAIIRLFKTSEEGLWHTNASDIINVISLRSQSWLIPLALMYITPSFTISHNLMMAQLKTETSNRFYVFYVNNMLCLMDTYCFFIKIFLFTTWSKSALQLTQPPIQLVPMHFPQHQSRSIQKILKTCCASYDKVNW